MQLGSGWFLTARDELKIRLSLSVGGQAKRSNAEVRCTSIEGAGSRATDNVTA